MRELVPLRFFFRLLWPLLPLACLTALGIMVANIMLIFRVDLSEGRKRRGERGGEGSVRVFVPWGFPGLSGFLARFLGQRSHGLP
jgi:hypothetical protein